jgi:phage terminase Nu1 subunit (DNA packaging protein)
MSRARSGSSPTIRTMLASKANPELTLVRLIGEWLDMADTPDTDDDSFWCSIAELAELKGHSRQAVHERVTKLEGAGKIATRRGKGGTRLVQVAAYDLAVGETTSLSHAQAAETVRRAPPDRAYTKAQTRLAQYQADLKELELKQKIGELVLAAEVRQCAVASTAAVGAAIDTLPMMWTEKICDRMRTAGAVLTAESERALRLALKQAAHDLRTRAADNFDAIAKGEDISQRDDDETISLELEEDHL